MAAAGGRVAAESCRVKKCDTQDPPLAIEAIQTTDNGRIEPLRAGPSPDVGNTGFYFFVTALFPFPTPFSGNTPFSGVLIPWSFRVKIRPHF